LRNGSERRLSVQVGVTFPQAEIGADPEVIRDYAQAAEDLGYEHLLAYDHVLGADPSNREDWRGYTHKTMFHEPLTLFSYLAAITKRLEFVSGVIVLPQRQETAAWFASWSWTILVYVPTSFMLLLFPDGRLPSPRWRPVAWCAVLGLICFLAGYALVPGPLEDFPRIMNPYGVDSLMLEAVAVAGVILASASMVASAISLIVRMRRAGRAQRQQIKWLAYGGALVVGTVFVGGVISVWIGEVGIALISLGLLGVPIFTGVAIARYRLYDIDLIINRTLVYATLTGMLALVYFGGVTAT